MFPISKLNKKSKLNLWIPILFFLPIDTKFNNNWSIFSPYAHEAFNTVTFTFQAKKTIIWYSLCNQGKQHNALRELKKNSFRQYRFSRKKSNTQEMEALNVTVQLMTRYSAHNFLNSYRDVMLYPIAPIKVFI